jgi:hypothetical protein
MRIRESPRLHFRIRVCKSACTLGSRRRETQSTTEKKTGRALLLLVLHSHFCQQSLEIQVDHSLADRVRARIVTGLPSNKRSFHPTIGKYFSSSRAIFKRRPANPSRVKKMSVNVSISQWWSTKIKELHHGRIRGAVRHCVTTPPKRDKFESKGSKHIFFGSFSVPEFYVETRRTCFFGGRGGANKISP